MKYNIRYTSGKEVESLGAIRLSYTRIDERTVDNPSKLNYRAGDDWYNEGTNHRLENGHIKRDFIDHDWFLEVPDLLAFIKQHGQIVVGPFYANPELFSIEIYDDYRE